MQSPHVSACATAGSSPPTCLCLQNTRGVTAIVLTRRCIDALGVRAPQADLSVGMHMAGIGDSESGEDLHNLTAEHKATKVAVLSDTKPWLAPTGEPSLAALAFVLLDGGAPIGWAGMAIGELRPGKFVLPVMVPGSVDVPLKGASFEAEVRWL